MPRGPGGGSLIHAWGKRQTDLCPVMPAVAHEPSHFPLSCFPRVLENLRKSCMQLSPPVKLQVSTGGPACFIHTRFHPVARSLWLQLTQREEQPLADHQGACTEIWLKSVAQNKNTRLVALKHVYYHMWSRSPVQVLRMRGCWCTAMTLRDGMRREVEGGFRMGNTGTPMADSCQCMAKTTTIRKVISFQLK